MVAGHENENVPARAEREVGLLAVRGEDLALVDLKLERPDGTISKRLVPSARVS